MGCRPETFLLLAAMLAGAMWLPMTSQGAPVQAGFFLARHVDYRVRMEREAAGYVRNGYRALRRGQYKKARAWFLKAKKLFPDHKGANAGLRQVGVAEARARKRAEAKRRAAARRKRLYFTNSIGMKFRLIPAGSFMMGSPSSEQHRYSDEGPQHHVVISHPFYMQTTEVTQSQYRTVMGANPSRFTGCDRCPVEQVSWYDAQEFIRRLNAREKKYKYRLPTEVEWEYACRAGNNSVYSFGDGPQRLGEYAWYWNNSGNRTHLVGQKRPNAWGLHDMYGNVREWCGDWYASDYYRSSPARDPQGPSSGKGRVLRGGSWEDFPEGLRSAYRFGSRPPGDRSSSIGFRVVRIY